MIEGRTILCFASGYDAPPTSKHHVMHLLAEVARKRPDWHIVMIGDSTVDLAPYRSLPNMHFLGRKPYADLPAYCRQFDVGLIPFKVNELTKAVNPIKLREYLAAGLPVVSTPLPEAKVCAHLIHVGADLSAFAEAVELALAEHRAACQGRVELMTGETWQLELSRIEGMLLNSTCSSQGTSRNASEPVLAQSDPGSPVLG